MTVDCGFCCVLFHTTVTTTFNTVLGNTVTCYKVKGLISFAAIVRVILVYVAGEVPCVTKYGHVDVTSVGGVEVVTTFDVAVGPMLRCVPIINFDFVMVRCLPDVDCDGPATGEGVRASASESTEYV